MFGQILDKTNTVRLELSHFFPKITVYCLFAIKKTDSGLIRGSMPGTCDLYGV